MSQTNLFNGWCGLVLVNSWVSVVVSSQWLYSGGKMTSYFYLVFYRNATTEKATR